MIVVAISSYLFWPLEDPERYKIVWDKEKLAYKYEFLSNLELGDSIKRPNIIIMMAGDLGKAEVSIYGNSKVPTPNIDAIALEGVKFNEAYITSPIWPRIMDYEYEIDGTKYSFSNG